MRTRLTSHLAAFGLGGLSVLCATTDTLRTKRLEVQDNEGRTRISAHVDKAGPRIDLGERDRAGVSMWVNDERGEVGMTIRDDGGAAQCSLIVPGKGTAQMLLGTRDGHQVEVSTGAEGAVLSIKDRGRPTAWVGPMGDGVVVGLGGDGQGGDLLMAASPRGAKLAFSRQGKERLTLGVGEDGAAGVNLQDQTGRVRVAFVVRPDGSAGLMVYDANGATVAFYGLDANGELREGRVK